MPEASEMAAGLESEREIREARPRPQFPHGDYVDMADALARRVGVYPDATAWSDLEDSLRNGPLLLFHYRLAGPGKKYDVAKRAIEQCEARYPRV